MTGWAITFLVLALIAAALGLSGLAGAAAPVAWVFAAGGLITAIVLGVTGRRPPE
jgi:uncharacterized membrane protein YtjA (UPF0391 family)